ncbi:MAG: S8 family peptidase [Elainellaceae cyanobacterium]
MKWQWGVLFLVGLGWALTTMAGGTAEYDGLILDFHDDLSPAQIEHQLEIWGLASAQLNSPFSEAERTYLLPGANLGSAADQRQRLKQLRRSELKALTEAIEPNYIYHAAKVPNDPGYPEQWNFGRINIEPAWDETQGEGVTVAVIDTGISRVKDLAQTKFAKGYNFVDNGSDTADDNGHGTHIAGTIAQSTDNGYGVAGIAHGATLMPLKVLSASGGGTVVDIAEAVRYAADNGANVINLSLGGLGDSAVLRQAIDYAHNKGAVIVAAAGNADESSAAYPARYPHAIAVSATDATGVKAPYSNYGAGVNIAAPGGSTSEAETGGILQDTIVPNEGKSALRSLQGTSMATAHVSGVAALVLASGVDGPDEVAQVLYQSSRAGHKDELNYLGAGHLDAAAAVKLAQAGKISPKDFFHWLNRNGYLNLRFWFDGGVVALLPKLGMVVGSYLLAWLLRTYLPVALPLGSGWLASGLIGGSAGAFFLRGLYLFDLPQWPLRVMGSSIPELGTAVGASGALNPLTASALIPLALVALLLSHPTLKWFAIGSTLGVASCLAISAFLAPTVVWLGGGAIASLFLLGNAGLCVVLAALSLRGMAARS